MTETVLVNDQFLQANAAAIASQDRGFLLGDGVFTTIKYEPPVLLFFQQHYQRLLATAARFHLLLEKDAETLEHLCHQVIMQNQYKKRVCAVRITLSRGATGGRGLAIAPNTTTATLIISATLCQQRKNALRLSVATIRRHSTMLTAHYKTLNYLDAIMSRHDAIAAGFDDALLLNENDLCICTTTANVFAVMGRQIMTPALKCGVLPGIMRAAVMQRAKTAGFSVLETELPLKLLQQADEVFITNSLIGVLSVSHIDQQAFPVRQGITQRLQSLMTSR